MKFALLAATAIAFTALPATAQHSGHGGHSTPSPEPAPAQPSGHAGHSTQPPAPTPDHSGHSPSPPARPTDAGQKGHAAQPVPTSVMPEDHSGHGAAAPTAHQGHGDEHSMTGALGPYPASREASGTAWQPDLSDHGGVHLSAGDWMIMGHALVNGVYSWQEGPRGDEKAFVAGMVMGMARRSFADGSTFQLRTMLSPDPLMGKTGYPLHLAAGETADGVTTLVDRQHPHELFMEISASYSLPLSASSSLFLYGGLPGEPAFGPPAFMHRMSILDSPEAPITHHWLDSTHIVFGVLTAGLVAGNVKIEGSRFNGREPDQNRYDIETGALDSTSLRLSWNPTSSLSLQASWAHLVSPEQLEPDENSTRWSASAIYTRRFGDDRWWSTTLAWGRRSAEHDQLDAFALESAVGLGPWTLFGRAEHVETNELLTVGGHHGPVFNVAKISAGAIRDFRLGPNLCFGVGAQYARNFVPDTLEALYAGDPGGAMLFVRLKLD